MNNAIIMRLTVMKKKNRSASILFKALFRNFFKILVFYPKLIFMACNHKKYSDEEKYNYGLRMVKYAVDTSGISIEAYGLENIPEKDGFYLCANHQEKFDPLAIWYSFPRQIGVILDDVATHRPFIHEICRLFKTQKLIKHDIHSMVTAYNEITNNLKKGINYMIFPEGGYEEEDGSFMIDLNDNYYGEMEFQMQYRNIKGDQFPWLYIDFNTLQMYAEDNGFHAEMVHGGDHYDYLAKIYR